MDAQSVEWLVGLIESLESLAQQFVDKMPEDEYLTNQEPPERAFARGQVAAWESTRELINTAVNTQ